MSEPLAYSNGESKLLGVSMRGWLAMLIVGTACAMALLQREIAEPLSSVLLLTIGFYFGQKTA